jgi:type II secretion system protein N
MNKAILGGLAAVWGLVIFVVALHVHFPGDAALERAQWEVQQATDGGWAIDAGEANLWRLTGVTADDVVVYKVDQPKRKRRKADDEDADTANAVPFLRAERARARLALLPLLKGEQQLAFDADVYGGSVVGRVGQGSSTRSLVLAAEDLDLSRVPLEGEDWMVDATGRLKVDADLTLDAEDVEASAGTLKLSIDDFGIQSARAMGLDLTPASFSEAVVEIEVEDGKATIQNGSFVGDLLELELAGDITLSNRAWTRWRMKVDLKLKLGEELDSMARFLPTLKGARGSDDRYHFVCSGSVRNPRCRPDKSGPGVKATGAASVGAGGPGRRAGLMGGDKVRAGRVDRATGDDEAEDGDRSAARERRLERIRERRERLRKRREERRSQRDDVVDGEEFDVEPAPDMDDLPPDFDEPLLDDVDGDGRPGFDPPANFRPDLGPPPDFDGPQGDFGGPQGDFGDEEFYDE